MKLPMPQNAAESSYICIKTDDPPDKETEGKDCTASTKHTSRTTSEAYITCKMPGGVGTMHSKAIYEMQSTEKYTATITVVSPSGGGGDANPITFTKKIVGTFIRPDCGDVD